MVGAAWGTLFTAILAVLIVVGSRNLQHFDAALVGYTFAVLFAAFGITLPLRDVAAAAADGAVLAARLAGVLPARATSARNLADWFARVVARLRAEPLHLRRGRLRGAAHLLIMWGCMLAAAITFPLVFGWVHFETVPGDLDVVSRLRLRLPDVRLPDRLASSAS